MVSRYSHPHDPSAMVGLPGAKVTIDLGADEKIKLVFEETPEEGVEPLASDPKGALISRPSDLLEAILALGRKGLKFQRYKGLGEMNPEQLWTTTMDPSKRSLKQVSIESAAEADHLFSMLMGDEVPPRKHFIQSNAKTAKLDI